MLAITTYTTFKSLGRIEMDDRAGGRALHGLSLEGEMLRTA